MRISTGILVALTAVASVPAWADVILTDATFSFSNYTETALYSSDPSNIYFAFQCTLCGDPGHGLEIDTYLPNVLDETAQGFVNNTVTYNPATEGAIASISAAVDKDLSTNQDANDFANTFRPLIEQDGVYYLAAIPGPSVYGYSSGYNLISGTGLTAADFIEFDFVTGTFGTANPDFDGDAMQFGLAQITQTGQASNLIQAKYDNLTLDIANGISSVPEPSSLALLGLGLCVLAAARRRACYTSLRKSQGLT